MSLDEQEAIWGINLANAKDYGSLRQYLNFIVLGICIIVALSVISIMNSNTITIGNYMSTMLLLGLVFYAIHDACHRNKLYRVYCFYRRYKRCEICKVRICISKENLCDAIYRTKKYNLSEFSKLPDFINIINDSCIADSFYAQKIVRNIMKYNESCKSDYFITLTYVHKKNKDILVSLYGEESDSKKVSAEVIDAADVDDIYEFSPELDDRVSASVDDTNDTVVEDTLTRR